eukprot:TRINITY_DN14112_c0_g1_i1.p1 TRINITY_DN14112_c0_g1~~TRINITY_DN14112_c0_g1_i1.p1  ORF type:complete len:191 (-),score=31.02 TRINITY_DN14112_c0_g1_i1:165-737(-)
MRSSQALLRLAGGLASALLLLAALLVFFLDVLREVALSEMLRAAHHLGESILLGGFGAAGVLAEIRPHPTVSENAPYLSKPLGRGVFYLLSGSYVIGRQSSSFQSWADCFVGSYVVAVALANLVLAQRLEGLPPQLSEPALGGQLGGTHWREMTAPSPAAAQGREMTAPSPAAAQAPAPAVTPMTQIQVQ